MFRCNRRLLALLAFAAAASLHAQGPRIFIVTDMEGVGGVNDASEQILPGQRRYDQSRRLLTGELNSAIQGALAAGASEVVVWDGHDGSRSLSIDQINAAAQLIQGKPTPADYYLSDRRFDGVFFIGQHAMAGAPNAVLAHSQSFAVSRITLNGKPVGEIGQVAAIAAYFHIPVVMLAGDQAACDEIRALQPGAETAAVKRLAGKASSWSLSHERARQIIFEAASQAVRRIREFHPWMVEGPVEMRVEYKDGRPPSVYKGATVLEAYQAWLGK